MSLLNREENKNYHQLLGETCGSFWRKVLWSAKLGSLTTLSNSMFGCEKVRPLTPRTQMTQISPHSEPVNCAEETRLELK